MAFLRMCLGQTQFGPQYIHLSTSLIPKLTCGTTLLHYSMVSKYSFSTSKTSFSTLIKRWYLAPRNSFRAWCPKFIWACSNTIPRCPSVAFYTSGNNAMW